MYNKCMNLHEVSNWLLQHAELVGLLATIAAGVGAIYKPTRDLITALPKFIKSVIKFAFKTIWFIIWPLRKLVAWTYFKYTDKYVDKLFEKISNWLDKREIAKEKLRDINSPIKPTEL